MKKGVLSVIAVVLAVFSLSACGKSESNTTQSGFAPSTTTSGQSFEDWTDEYWELRASRLSEEEKTSTTMQPTTTSTETTRQTTTRTTTRTTAPSRTETTTVTTTATTTVPKTTRPATQDELDAIYDMVYNEVMAAYYQYKMEQEAYIADIKADIDGTQKTISGLYAACQREMEKYQSETAKNMVYNQYQNSVAPLYSQINELNKELAQAEQDYANAEAELESIIWGEYLVAVEEFQKNTLS